MPTRFSGQASGLRALMPHLPVCSFSANSSNVCPVGAIKRSRSPHPLSSLAGTFSVAQPHARRSDPNRFSVSESTTLNAVKSHPARSVSENYGELVYFGPPFKVDATPFVAIDFDQTEAVTVMAHGRIQIKNTDLYVARTH